LRCWREIYCLSEEGVPESVESFVVNGFGPEHAVDLPVEAGLMKMILKNERKDVQKTFDELFGDELRIRLVDWLHLAYFQNIVDKNQKTLAYAGKILLVEVRLEGGEDLVYDSGVLVCFGVMVDYLV
jgi:hypothetical protein